MTPDLAPSTTADPTTSAPLRTVNMTVGYDSDPIIDDLTLDIPASGITSVIGPNGCGKSTLLRALSRLLNPTSGTVLLQGKNIAKMRTRDVAQQMGLLPQSPTAPEALTVADLVARGRYPHQSWLRQWSATDVDVVDAALRRTGVRDLADRPIDSLSGGQRQRVWISMTLAQETDLLLLDEPTTYLDLAHAVDVLDLVHDLATSGKTVVMVLHDLNLAIRYSDHLIVMRDGKVVTSGAPSEVITQSLLQQAFGLASQVVVDPMSGKPLIIPIGRRGVRSPSASAAMVP